MADLGRLREFAREQEFGLTRPLTHHQVVVLAQTWQPEAFFHVDERFHPIAMAEAPR